MKTNFALLDDDYNNSNNEVSLILTRNETIEMIEMLKLAKQWNRDKAEQQKCEPYFDDLIKVLDRSYKIGKIRIFGNKERTSNGIELTELITELDGYEDNKLEVLGKWTKQFEIVNPRCPYSRDLSQWVYFEKYHNSFDVRKLARVNQSWDNKDFKVVKRYFYQCI
jgi:hypothetical protein